MTVAMRWPSSTSNIGNSIVCKDNIHGEEKDDDDDDDEVALEQETEQAGGGQDEIPVDLPRRQNCCTRFSNRFPRLFSILFGIYIPIFVLVLLSCVFGYWIAHIESPVEIQENDSILASFTITNKKLQILSNLTSVSPKICFNLFLNNVTSQMLMSSSLIDILYEGTEEDPSSSTDSNASTTDNNDGTPIEVLHQISVRYQSIADDTVPDIYNNSLSMDAALNIIDLYNYLQLCGDKFRSFIYNETGLTILPLSGETTSYSSTGVPLLYFSWNRCTPYQLVDQPNFRLSLHPANQTQYYISAWENDTIRLYDYYYNYYTTVWNVSTNIAVALAQQQSVAEATGNAACVVNTFSGGTNMTMRATDNFILAVQLILILSRLPKFSAWFWFTIMSTIGYVRIFMIASVLICWLCKTHCYTLIFTGQYSCRNNVWENINIYFWILFHIRIWWHFVRCRSSDRCNF
jgi:hypothetical protein